MSTRGAAVLASEDKKLSSIKEGFEGPIDVLLSLARDQKVDLTQISILELADQYLLWVAKIRQSNLNLLPTICDGGGLPI